MTGESTVEVALWATLSLTVLKTVLVTNAIWSIFRRGRKVVSGLTRTAGLASRLSQATPALAPSNPSRGQRSSKFRSVHRRLLLMHFLAIVAQLAGIGQYVLPMTDSGCVAVHRVMMASLVLFDGTIVLFLLAKTGVTNNIMEASAAAKKCWENVVRMFSLFWACICLPATAVLCAAALPGGVDHEDGGCHGGIESFTDGDDSTLVFFIAFTAGKIVLIIELMLLLAIFVKPLFARGDDGQYSIRPRYRRTVVRNIACTVGVVVLQLAEEVVVFTVVYHKGGTEKVERIADVAVIVQVFLTLCLTEVTIPFGFTSFIAWARNNIATPSRGSSDGCVQHFAGDTILSAIKPAPRRSTFVATSTSVKTATRRLSFPNFLSLLRNIQVHLISEEHASALEPSVP